MQFEKLPNTLWSQMQWITEDKTKSNKSVSSCLFECLNNNDQCEKSIDFNKQVVHKDTLSSSSGKWEK